MRRPVRYGPCRCSVAIAREAADGMTLHRDQPGHGPAAGAPVRKVLVVDDERDLADLAQALLAAHGIAASVAYDAAAALQALDDDAGIDAMFSDVTMPGMNGLQLAQAARARHPQLMIVLTSGFTAPALTAELGRQFLFTAKPYRIEAVIAKLRGAP